MEKKKKSKNGYIEDLSDSGKGDKDLLLQLQAVILDALPVIAALIDHEGKIVLVNEAWKEFGAANGNKDPQYGIGLNYLGACTSAVGKDSEEAESANKGVTEVLQGIKSEFSLDYPCHSLNDKRWFRLIARPVLFKDCRYVVVMHVNISRLVKTEEALNESEERYKVLFENASDAIFVHDLAGMFLEVNDAACRRLGYSRNEMMKMGPADIDAPQYAESVKEKISAIIEHGQAIFEVVQLHKNGTPIHTELNSCLIEFKGVPAVLSIARDITLRKRNEFMLQNLNTSLEEKIKERARLLEEANRELQTEIAEKLKVESALRESRERYRLVADFTYGWEYWIGTEEELLYVSPSCFDITGYTSEEFMKEPRLFERIIHPEDFEIYKEKSHRGKRKQIEFRILHRCGEIRWIGHVCQPVYSSEGEMLGIRGSNRDITEQKKAEKSLRESEARSRALLNALPDMIFQFDLEGRYLACHCSSENTMYIASPEDFLGRRISDVMPQNLAAKFMEMIKKVNKTGAIEMLEYSLPVSGSLLYFETRIVKCGHERFLSVVRNITEQKKAEDQIKKLSQAVEQNPAIILITNTEGEIEYVNPKFCEVTGYSYQEVLGENPRMLKSGLTSLSEYKRLWKTIKSGRNWRGEFCNRKKNGELFWELTSISPVKNSGGSITHFIAVKEDITEKKQAEARLSESEERYRSLFEKNSAVMLLIDPQNLMIKDANAAACSFYGYSKEELLEMKISDINIKPYGQLQTMIRGVLKNHDGHFFFRHRLKSGEIRDVEVHNGVLRLKGRSLLYAIIHDVTDRMKAEKQLSEYKEHLELLVEERTHSLIEVNKLLSEEIAKQKAAEEEIQNRVQFLRILIDTIPSPVFIKDETGRFLDCNKSFEKTFELRVSQIKNKTMSEVLPAGLAEKFEVIDKSLLEIPGSVSLEVDYTSPKGKEYNILVSQAAYMRSDRTTGGIVGVVVDISEHKLLQKEIQNALKQEKELNELKSRFISTASHEFRTPLTSILASADLLEMFGREWKEEKFYEHIGKIQKGVDYMKELLDDVLTMSRADTGRIGFSPVKINFFELCSEALEDIKVSASEKHLFRFNFNSAKKLLMLDDKLLRHILSNLLSNAVKYSPEGGEVIFTVSSTEKILTIEVKDQGIGIASDDLKKLFEPFYRGNNVSGIHGTGLGLSIVKKSVEMHGGQIKIESEVDKGSCFIVTIPLGNY